MSPIIGQQSFVGLCLPRAHIRTIFPTTQFATRQFANMDLAAVQAFEGAVDDQREVVAAVTVGERTHFFGAKLLKRGEGDFSFETTAWPEGAPKSSYPRDLQLQIQFGTSGAVVQLRAHVQAIAASRNAEGVETIAVRCGKPSELALVQRRAHFRASGARGRAAGIVGVEGSGSLGAAR